MVREVRIFVATFSRALLGGVESYLRSVIPLFGRAGHRITFAYEFDDSTQSRGIVNGATNVLQLTNDWQPGRTERPDLVFLHGIASVDCEARLVDWAPTAYFAHNYWGICISGSKRWGIPQERICTKTFSPTCLLHYFPHRCGGLDPRVAVRSYREQQRRLDTIRRCEALIVGSRYVGQEYQRNGMHPGRIHVLAPYVSKPEGNHRPQRTLQSGEDIRLLFLGRITSLKGLEYLIDAARDLSLRLARRCVVVVGGTGPGWQSLEKRAVRAGVKVEYHGWVDWEARDRLIEGATLLVIPSTWPEPFGLVGLEAASQGLPTVAFPVGGIREWLEPGVNGELAAAPSNVEALVDALVKALSSPTHYAALCQGASTRAARFTPESHLQSLTQIFQSAISQRIRSL